MRPEPKPRWHTRQKHVKGASVTRGGETKSTVREGISAARRADVFRNDCAHATEEGVLEVYPPLTPAQVEKVRELARLGCPLDEAVELFGKRRGHTKRVFERELRQVEMRGGVTSG